MCSNPQTKKLRWIVRRGAFGGAGHVGPDCRDGGAFVCCHGGAFHDGRRGSLLFLRLFGELDHDALQNEGSRVKQDGMITRFGLFFGGLVTAIAGVIAKQFGAAVGGLFLAFPAIFPASATLIEKREKQKKEKKGHTAPRAEGKPRVWAPPAQRWGASVCSCLLLIVWHFIPNHRAWAVLKIATLAGLGVSVMRWMIRKRV